MKKHTKIMLGLAFAGLLVQGTPIQAREDFFIERGRKGNIEAIYPTRIILTLGSVTYIVAKIITDVRQFNKKVGHLREMDSHIKPKDIIDLAESFVTKYAIPIGIAIRIAENFENADKQLFVSFVTTALISFIVRREITQNILWAARKSIGGVWDWIRDKKEESTKKS